MVRFRWILGLGALPSVVALLASLQGPEDTFRGNGESIVEGFRQALSCRQLQRRLIGTAGSWFLFDVAAYGGLSTKGSYRERGPSWKLKDRDHLPLLKMVETTDMRCACFDFQGLHLLTMLWLPLPFQGTVVFTPHILSVFGREQSLRQLILLSILLPRSRRSRF